MTDRLVSLALLFAVSLPAQNLLKNPSFERHEDDQPAGWHWTGGTAKATLAMDTQVARSGKASIRIANPSARAPHVYGCLTQTVALAPNRTYTFSCYVRAEDAGVAWIGGGAKWQYRVMLPRDTKGKWERVSGTFTTGGGEKSFTLRLITESKTEGLWLDDMQVEPGGVPTDFVYYAPLEPGEVRLELSPFDPGQNLVPNASFEQVDAVRPKGWVWDQRNTNATMTVMREGARTGTVCLRFTNGTPFGAHVYGWFGLTGGVTVEPNTAYTLTAFVRTESHSRAWIGGGNGWKVRCGIPNTNGEWRRISKTFTTQEDETNFALMLVSEAPTDGIWLDDLSLRKGIRPLPADLEGANPKDYVDLAPKERDDVLYRGSSINTRWAVERWPIDEWTFSSGQFRADGILTVVDPAEGSEVIAELRDSQGQVLLTSSAAVPVGNRAFFLTFRGNIERVRAQEVVLYASVRRAGRTLAEHTQKMQLVTPKRIRAKMQESTSRRDQLAELVEKLEARGLGAYSRVTLTILDNFIPWVEADVKNDRADRAWDEANTLAEMTERETARAAEILAGTATDFPVPRYRTGPLKVRGPSTVGTLRYPDGREVSSPVFLTGYGHFSQVRKDVEKFPDYGCNFLQIEFGPRNVLPTEDTYTDSAIDAFLSVCDRAAAANVSVNLLLSPHYFPAWALNKWPDLKECKGGFFNFCVHDPRARSVIEKSLRYVIPRIKDKPALHSVCLSNEPICVDLRGCKVTAKAWPAWLAKQHGDIATLNQRWGSDYKSFAEIPIPPPEFTSTPMSVDFVRYNQESFAAFHAWMGGVIHEIAPGLPVHAKFMMSAHFHRGLNGMWSVSPELFAESTQYNGNDCCDFFSRGGESPCGWRGMEAAYDFQRSMADMPVFNSENHMILDRDHGVIPPEHLYTELWQGAIHGQSSTTFWVWERTNAFDQAVSGSILHRPDGIEAFGRCNLDLNRLAAEVTSIQSVAPEIGVLWSASSTIMGDLHKQAMFETYGAAAFLGAQLGFVTERRLEAFARGETKRPLDSLKVLLVPQVTHLSDQARAGLAALASKTHVVVLGKAPALTEYGQPAAGSLPGDVLPMPDTDRELFALLAKQLPSWGVKPLVPVLGPTGRLAFGVEVRSASHRGQRVASVCNLLREPQTVNVGAPSTDLISGRKLPAQFTLDSLQPVLLQLP